MKKIQLFVILSSLLIFSTAAMCEPIYLECKANNDNEKNKRIWEITVDESNNHITHILKGKASYNTKGVFSSDSISYSKGSNIDNLVIITENVYIDRITLDFKHEVFIKNNIDGSTETQTDIGECIVLETPKRKI